MKKKIWIVNYTLLVMLAIGASSGNAQTFTTIDVPGAASTIPMKFPGLIVGTYADDTGKLHGFTGVPGIFDTVDLTQFGTNTIVTGWYLDNGGPETGGQVDWVGGQDTDGTSCLDPGTGVCRGFWLHFECYSGCRGGPAEIHYPNSTSTMVFSGTGYWSIRGPMFVGAYTRQDGTVHGFRRRWLEGFMTIDPPNAVFSFATDLNPPDIVGRWDTPDGTTHGYLLRNDQYSMIDVPDAVSTVAWGIDDARTIVGEYIDADGITHGFRLPDGGDFETIDFPNAIATRCRSVFSFHGTSVGVVGSYTDSDGVEHGFLLRP